MKVSTERGRQPKKRPPELHIIKTTHRPVDITALLRAEIEQRDWSKCHVAGDRNPPLDIADRPKRGWRK